MANYKNIGLILMEILLGEDTILITISLGNIVILTIIKVERIKMETTH